MKPGGGRQAHRQESPAMIDSDLGATTSSCKDFKQRRRSVRFGWAPGSVLRTGKLAITKNPERRDPAADAGVTPPCHGCREHALLSSTTRNSRPNYMDAFLNNLITGLCQQETLARPPRPEIRRNQAN